MLASDDRASRAGAASGRFETSLSMVVWVLGWAVGVVGRPSARCEGRERGGRSEKESVVAELFARLARSLSSLERTA